MQPQEKKQKQKTTWESFEGVYILPLDWRQNGFGRCLQEIQFKTYLT